jgi:serine/threonine-protein kinase HipA
VNLYERALLFFVLGNGDAHLKKFSLLKREEVGYSLSPAYDIVNSRLVLPEEKEEMRLRLQGKRNNISRKDFKGLSEHFGLNSKQTNNALERLDGLRSSMEMMIEENFLEERLRSSFLEIYKVRMERVFE